MFESVPNNRHLRELLIFFFRRKQRQKRIQSFKKSEIGSVADFGDFGDFDVDDDVDDINDSIKCHIMIAIIINAILTYFTTTLLNTFKQSILN